MTTRRRKAGARSVFDPIALEVLRSRIQSIAEDAAVAIERTSVSPTATETNDLSATLLDADGSLVAGGGYVSFHWVAATNAVRAIIERYGDEIAPGDVFLANDPYNGGGLHPNDVFVSRPLFVGKRLVAWVALSAHLIDMGGMAAGSFAPAATDCYQEAFRVPPVRLFREGTEVSDVWDLLRTNVRASWVVEMDLRALVAGAHVAQERLGALVDAVGVDEFVEAARALQQLSERELRKRIAALPDGRYRASTWAEWEDERYAIPCTLTVDGDSMIFDFEGASPQVPHFINSQPYIIKSAMVMQFARFFTPDLPYSEGLLTPLEIRCPEQSIVKASPPAPMNAGHMHAGSAAAEMMLQCVRLALWAADPPLPVSRYVTGWSGAASLSVGIWSGNDDDGTVAIWGMVEGAWSGGAAGAGRDGGDTIMVAVGMAGAANETDIEVLESWYPMLVHERHVRQGVNGAGEYRSGGGYHMRFQPYRTTHLSGEMLGEREFLPIEGAAGGFPGSTTIYRRIRSDGTVERISTKASGVIIGPGESFEFFAGSGGGVGDPLDRVAEAVAQDVAIDRISADEAAAVYGVVLRPGPTRSVVDDAATAERRDQLRADRLARANPPVRPVALSEIAKLATGPEQPLYPGIVQRGAVAFVQASGTPLAIAPDHWTDGCPMLEEPRASSGPTVIVRAYLDPGTGRTLHVEAVPEGEGRAFEVSPIRWTGAAPAG